MSQGIIEAVEAEYESEIDFDAISAAVENLVTEDDAPVDNIFSEKQQRLLTETLYSSWTPPPVAADEAPPASVSAAPAAAAREPRRFLVAANVGLFPSMHQPPLVPDVFLSLDVAVAEDWYAKSKRSYFFWQFGKAPEVVIEIVSNRKGGELSTKLHAYARTAVTYYIVHDPTAQLSGEALQGFELRGGKYERLTEVRLPLVGLSLALWQGTYEGKAATWLRWHDERGDLIPTGAERAAHEAERATHEAERATRLAAKLRELGVDPEQI
ncbi:MAG: Uma2 family endonuclease [Acidobacteriota bacterium]|nr:Uma2 family endonuclease [Acidobacteriota bacterium]